jgi:DNA processing protein
MDREDNIRTETGKELRAQIRYIRRQDREYPSRFDGLPHMPEGIYVLGCLPDAERPTVGIVGARDCTAYGRIEAERFGTVLAGYGVQVISGLAYGVDAWAQKGALTGGGKTFAVLGTGVDVCYPKQNYALYRRILREGGGMISEFEPGARPQGWHFPIRNRLISALSDVVLVVEARLKSGSLITADCAIDQGRVVYALPGRTLDEMSQGCNRLIAQGAGIAWTPEIILEELGISCRTAPGPLPTGTAAFAGQTDAYLRAREDFLGQGEASARTGCECQADRKKNLPGGDNSKNRKAIENLEISPPCDRMCDETNFVSGEKSAKKTEKKRKNIPAENLCAGGKTKGKAGGCRKKRRDCPHAHDFQIVYRHLDVEGKSIQKLHELTGMNIADLSSLLMQLCLSGYVKEVTPGFFSRM